MCQKLHSDIIKSYSASSVIWQFVIRALQFWWKERIENKTLLPSHLSSRLQLHFCILEAFIVQGSASSQDFRKVKLLPLFYKMGKGSLRREVGKEDWRGSQMVLGKNRYGPICICVPLGKSWGLGQENAHSNFKKAVLECLAFKAFENEIGEKTKQRIILHLYLV